MEQHVPKKEKYVHQIFTHSIQCIFFIVLASPADTTKTAKIASQMVHILSFTLTLDYAVDSSMFQITTIVQLALFRMEGDCANVWIQSCNALQIPMGQRFLTFIASTA